MLCEPCDLEFLACAEHVAVWDRVVSDAGAEVRVVRVVAPVEEDGSGPSEGERLVEVEKAVRKLSAAFAARARKKRRFSRDGSGLDARDRARLVGLVEGELSERASGSFYCWTAYRLVHLEVDAKTVWHCVCAYAGLLLQAFVLATVLDVKRVDWRDADHATGDWRRAGKG